MGRMGKGGGDGGKWGKWQRLLIVAPHFSNKKISNQKNFPTLCPHVGPQDGRGEVAICDFCTVLSVGDPKTVVGQ